ncbi:MAG: hypothetical protein AAB804_02655 [Patescibacteria group bacterium]
MRSAAYAFVVVFVALPMLAFGAVDTPCLSGTIQKKSFTFEIFGNTGIAEIKTGLKTEAQRLVSRNDRCSDEKIQIDGGKTTTVTLCVTRACKPDDVTYGCSTGQRNPQLLFGDPSRGYIAINKCHRNADIMSAIANTINEEKADALIALSERQPQLVATGLTQAPPLIPAPSTIQNVELTKVMRGGFDPTNQADRQKATQVLVNAGVPVGDANEAIKRIASGDAEGGQAIVRRDLNLNSGTFDQVAGLDPGSGRRIVDIRYPDRWGFGSQNTGFVSSGWSGGSHQSLSFGNPFLGIFAQLFSLFGQMNNSSAPSKQGSSGGFMPSTAQQQTFSLAQQVMDKLQGRAVSPDLNTALRPVAVVYAQPAVVMRGNPILVSWSSVGMKAGSCALRSGGTILAQKNEGARTIQTGQGTLRGAMTFSLSCAAANGETVERSTTVTVD